MSLQSGPMTAGEPMKKTIPASDLGNAVASALAQASDITVAPTVNIMATANPAKNVPTVRAVSGGSFGRNGLLGDS
jgi:hypothetical protein